MQADRTIRIDGGKGKADSVSFHATNRADVMPVTAWLPSHAYPKHSHDAFGIGYMVAGAQDSVYGRHSRITEAGDVMLTNPGEVHDGTPIDDQGRAFRMFYLEPGILYEAADDLGAVWSNNTEIAPSAAKDRCLAAGLHRLHNAYLEREDKLATDSLLAQITGRLVCHHGTERPDRQAGAFGAVERVRSLLADAPEESYELDQLAALAGLSKYHFVRSFKKAIGVTPFSYLTHRRVAKSMTLLRAGHNATEAALDSGFFDQSHFTRYFKQIYGVAPGMAARQAGLY
ncbi:helix-turn-helix transcriptional regulator [Aestuariispira insulae]|uniref:AraC family transcriptional regulator n=1 Tax=Aestuariispira insulae TaxID=1461337 RepID=A0A3D9HF70_9PROT|nr:AraC family transcriptional regulator [Aestuariispira insulae]RED48129.1 AraC family transcriptional regulator [Aestuariispira insulae]